MAFDNDFERRAKYSQDDYDRVKDRAGLNYNWVVWGVVILILMAICG